MGRLGAVFVLAAVVVLLIVWRYVSLMLLTPEEVRPAEGTVAIERGPILDRNGRVLAIQTELESVTAWVPDIEDFDRTAALLASALAMEERTIRGIFENRPGFAYVKRKVSNSAAAAVRSLINGGELPGIRLVEESARTYPEQKIAAPILGIVDIDNRGLEGLELRFDELLSPAPPDDTQTEAFGNQIYLTLDIDLQFTAERLALDTLEEQQADSVMVLAMDARNGDMLAMAGVPSFNPNIFADFPAAYRTNRPVAVAYEPGSVFKVFSIAAMMELGGVAPSSTFFCNGFYENSDIPDPIACLGVHGEVTPTQIIKYSCNAGAAYASESVDGRPFYGMLESFGFGRDTALPFPGESNGLLKSPSSWSARTKPTIAFGQEISVSAVQIVTAATVFANQGMLLEPHILRRVVSPEGRIIEEYGRTPLEQVLSPRTAEAMLLMMEEATKPGGTATRARVDGVRVSAKTGTAEVFNVETGRYSSDRFIASCLALLPTESPQAIVYVVIQNPQAGETYGGRIAAPVVRSMAEELTTYLGIPRAGDTVAEHSGIVTVEDRPSITIGSHMPDLTGYSKRELLPLLDLDDITVSIEGQGWVIRQRPEPGAPVPAGTQVELYLE